jgi:hypothetical protein
MVRQSLLGFACVIACASCVQYRFNDDTNLTRSGKYASSFEVALLESGKTDLACEDVEHHVVPIHATCTRGSCSASVDAIDGCGRRVVYGKKCERTETLEDAPRKSDEPIHVVSWQCHPALLSRADLGDSAADTAR